VHTVCLLTLDTVRGAEKETLIMLEKPDEYAKRQIDILLKEYDTLRAEILQRINARFAIIGLVGALLAIVVTKWDWDSQHTTVDLRWIIASVGMMIVVGTWWRFGIHIGLPTGSRQLRATVTETSVRPPEPDEVGANDSFFLTLGRHRMSGLRSSQMVRFSHPPWLGTSRTND
jgi:hypothetical protein